jgi:hypothetical protein
MPFPAHGKARTATIALGGLEGINMADDLRRTEPETERDANGRWIKGHTPEGAVPFGPHKNANPRGRPRSKPITSAYLDLLHEKLPPALRKLRMGKIRVDLREDATYLNLVVLAQCIEAARGNPLRNERNHRSH